MKRLLVISLWLALAVTVQAQTKVVVLSDTHLMAPELIINDGSAWQNQLKAERKMLDKSQELFDDMIERLKTELKPQLVFITGDLTKDGELASHEYVVRKLDELRAAGIHTLVIPGNHDLGNRHTVSYDGEITQKVAAANMVTFAKLYEHYGYGATSERENTSLTYTCEPIPGLMVIGIDSGENGWLSNMTLNWVCNKAEAARKAGKQVVALMHHPLFPHFHGIDKFVETAVITNFEEVRNRLADAGIGLIFTGHVHTSDIAKDFNGDLSKAIYDVNTGSLISYPCDYRTITVSPDNRTWHITTGHISALPSDPNFSTYSKQRLAGSIKHIMSEKSSALSLLADDAAECLIVHAEGNEHKSPTAQELLKKIDFLLQEADGITGMFPKLKDKIADAEKLANSLLKDISEYGVQGRENQTDDLTLTIELP